MAFKNKVILDLLKGYLRDKSEHILLFSFVAGSCSAPNFICYQNDFLCDLTYSFQQTFRLLCSGQVIPFFRIKGQSIQIVDVKRSHSVVILPQKIVYKVISRFPQNLKVYHSYRSTLYNTIVSRLRYKNIITIIIIILLYAYILQSLFYKRVKMEHAW